MLAIILFLFGAVTGAFAMAITGVPLVVMRVFRILPWDRRLWWVFAAVVAFAIVRDMVLASYNYDLPQASPEKFYFQVHLNGALASVVMTALLGLVLLCFIGKPAPDKTVMYPVAIPVALAVAALGVGMIVVSSKPIAAKRAAYLKGRLELATAIKTGDADALKKILAGGERLGGAMEELGGMDALSFAIEREDVAIVRVLLNPPRGQSPVIKTARMRGVIQKDNPELLAVFMEGKRRPERLGTALRAAIELDDRPLFDQLLAKGASPNAQTDFATPLIMCAKFGRIEMAQDLIQRGAHLDAIHRSPDLNRGATALITACDQHQADMAQLLIQKGADVNKTYDGQRSALQAACHVGDVTTVQRLIEAGSDVNYISDGRNESALHWTLAKSTRYDAVPLSEETKAQIITMLVDAGADTNHQNKYGQTATFIARKSELNLVLKALGQ